MSLYKSIISKEDKNLTRLLAFLIDPENATFKHHEETYSTPTRFRDPLDPRRSIRHYRPCVTGVMHTDCVKWTPPSNIIEYDLTTLSNIESCLEKNGFPEGGTLSFKDGTLTWTKITYK